MYYVLWMPSALSDLHGIEKYIAEDSDYYVRKLITVIIKRDK